jgi:hypothetical protein
LLKDRRKPVRFIDLDQYSDRIGSPETRPRRLVSVEDLGADHDTGGLGG